MHFRARVLLRFGAAIHNCDFQQSAMAFALNSAAQRLEPLEPLQQTLNERVEELTVIIISGGRCCRSLRLLFSSQVFRLHPVLLLF